MPGWYVDAACFNVAYSEGVNSLAGIRMLPSSRKCTMGAGFGWVLVDRAGWHRNPEKARAAAEQVAQMHDLFVDRHGSDLILVEGKNLPDVYAEAVAPTEGHDPHAVARSQAIARQTIEDSELVHASAVALLSHPVAGFGFYRDFAHVTRALDNGDAADSDDLDVLHGYLDDEDVPVWLLRRIVEERLPSSAAALGKALG